MNQMLATDSESVQKKARDTVNPLAGLLVASALPAAWCCDESKIRSGGKLVFPEDEMIAAISR